MASGKNTKDATKSSKRSADEIDFSADLIDALNKEFQTRVAYNLGNTESPTHVKRWISTGSLLLDCAIRNAREGGVPEGRIIEIYGQPSTGKSHLAFAIASTVQTMGGLVVYIDTENATPVEKLARMGIDVRKRFVYCDTHMTEEVFQIAESTIKKASSVVKKNKNIPILVVWDSVAATSPKAELEGDYDTNTVGLQARVISKAMRKIIGVIGQNNVTFLCLNQVRDKIGVAFGDPTTTPGGKAIPFHASVRIALTGGSAIKDKHGNKIGIKTYFEIKKNKVGPPFKRVELNIKFGEGIDETEAIFDILAAETKKTHVQVDKLCYQISGAAWRQFKCWNAETGEVLFEKKFQKAGFDELLNDPEFREHILNLLYEIIIVDLSADSQEEEDDMVYEDEPDTDE